MKKWKFYENHEIFMKIMIFDMSKHQVFPRNYLTFFKWQGEIPSGRPILAQNGEIPPILGFWAPESLISPKNGTLGRPAQNPT